MLQAGIPACLSVLVLQNQVALLMMHNQMSRTGTRHRHTQHQNPIPCFSKPSGSNCQSNIPQPQATKTMHLLGPGPLATKASVRCAGALCRECYRHRGVCQTFDFHCQDLRRDIIVDVHFCIFFVRGGGVGGGGGGGWEGGGGGCALLYESS